MRKLGIVFWSCLLIFSLATVTWAESGADELKSNDSAALFTWEVSLQEWNTNGWFDYLLYYPGRSQILSKVSFPQNQSMTILNVKYTLPDDGFFVRFQYGQSGEAIKGKGSDSDWNTEGSSTVTDYGDFDVYGDQSLVTFDFGKVLVKDDQQKVSVFLGVMQQDTSNELRNVVYHRFYGVDIEDQPQDDIGSTLDGMFRGVRLGIEEEHSWSKWTWTGMVGMSVLETKAYGYWANHDPAWNWIDSGYTVGWTATFSLQYAFTPRVSAELGYTGNYAKNYFDRLACDESISGEGFDADGAVVSDRVILRYKQQGFRLGLKVLF